MPPLGLSHETLTTAEPETADATVAKCDKNKSLGAWSKNLPHRPLPLSPNGRKEISAAKLLNQTAWRTFNEYNIWRAGGDDMTSGLYGVL